LEPSEVTPVLLSATNGSRAEADRLISVFYEDLRRIAARLLAGDRTAGSLCAAELVHEVYLRLSQRPTCRWESPAHFLRIAGRVMRRVLIDQARRRGRLKRGRGVEPLPLDSALEIGAEEPSILLLSLDRALTHLARVHPEEAELVALHFFAGRTIDECALALGVSARTAARRWSFARAWLTREMTSGRGSA